jgi:predicted glutamine amidotransferase
MCLLTFFPAGVLPNTEALLNGAYFNQDGYGYAIVTGEEIQVRHGLDAEQTIVQFDADRRSNPDGPALFHSRFATHGSTDTENCHPFRVGGDPRTVLAHNGVLPPVVQPGKTDPRSDTRILADDFLPVFGSMRIRRNRIRLQKWMTQANKIVILTVDRSFTRQAYILNEDAGTWDGGIWYSNDAYCFDDRLRFATSDGDDQYDVWQSRVCFFCGAGREYRDECCRACGGCFDCGEEREDCQCYLSERERLSIRR